MTCARGCCPDQRSHYLSIGISAAAMPTRSGPVIAKLQRDKDFAKDGPAYKRLRANGLQPRQIDGSAEIEQRAGTRVEVETGKMLNRKKRAQLEAITDNSADKIRVHEPGGLAAT